MASGLLSEQSWIDLLTDTFDRFRLGPRARNNPITGAFEDSDESLMRHVENLLGVVQANDHRNRILSVVGGYRIEHPNEPISLSQVFPEVLRKLQDSVHPESIRNTWPKWWAPPGLGSVIS